MNKNDLEQLTERLEARLRERGTEMEVLVRRLHAARSDERQRLAKILHDDLQQLLYGLQLKMSVIRTTFKDDTPAALASEIEDVTQWLARACSVTRDLARDLNPPAPPSPDLAGPLKRLATELDALYGLSLDLDAPEDILLDDASRRDALLECSRTLLVAMARRAGVSEAVLALSIDDGGIRVTVTGRTYRSDGAPPLEQASRDLSSIRASLNRLGGTLETTRSPGPASRFVLTLPREGP